MLSFGPVSFLYPLALLGLLSLPAIWLIVRAIPPQPRRQVFPPLALLRRLADSEPPAARTPPWLLLLRLAIAALLFLALAGPVWQAAPEAAGDGSDPLLLVVDSSWTAAHDWPDRRRLMDSLIDRAARQSRPVALLPTAPDIGARTGSEETPQPPDLLTPAEARRRLAALTPAPFLPDYRTAAARIEAMEGTVEAHWISDGLDHPDSADLHAAMESLGRVTSYAPTADKTPLALLPLQQAGLDLVVTAHRPARPYPSALSVLATTADGRQLATTPLTIAAGESLGEARLSLPREMRNRLARIRIAGHDSAGTVMLLDARAARPEVGLATGGEGLADSPLRAPAYYLERALEPRADIRRADVDSLLDRNLPVLILADIGALPDHLRSRMDSWIRSGGALIRFAGPRMAAERTGLTPVPLRSGERSVGGALSWQTPRRLATFEEDGPFAGLPIPENITVSRQLLAAPGGDLGGKVWARLEDGTPLVTGARRGDGWLVLVHTTANADWSDLALSGLFVDMLDRLLELAQGAVSGVGVGTANAELAAQRVLDGSGRLVPPPEGLAALSRQDLTELPVGPDAPPGLYGAPGAALARDLIGSPGPIDPAFRFVETSEARLAIDGAITQAADLRPPLMAALLALLMLDMLAGPLLRGWRPGMVFQRRKSAGALLLALCWPLADSQAQSEGSLDVEFALEATEGTRFAYVVSGDERLDRLSRAGLAGLGRVLELRTAVRLDSPMAVDPSRQPLTVFPLVYWPVPETATSPDRATLTHLRDYIASGGIVVFDTGAGQPDGGGLDIASPAARQSLQRLLGPLDLPRLIPVEDPHVLTRSFYLLDSFPGRRTGETVWAVAGSAGEDPIVSPVVITGNDWASAWALDDNDRFLVPDLAGGNRQRELAFRSGVNLAMYALTGTYKADQLHLPALMDRLGE